MARAPPPCVDTLIIGNGPSALLLSFILHGHIPHYIGGHYDAILDSKLAGRPHLLDLKPDLYAHFLSSLRYSTQALPVNTLLDTLLRPNADTDLNPTSCVEWRYEPGKAVSHIAVGQAPHAGGQWAEKPVCAGANMATLSYAEQLSLPGYSYADHLARKGKEEQYDFVRPTRADMADYLKTYPEAVGISQVFYNGIKAEDIHRTRDGFIVAPLGIRCKHLVLASGIFTVNIPPPPLLAPIAHLDARHEPLLVIGSGFSAADTIISAPRNRKIIHIFRWSPETRPSPLKGCHHSAYPEYATVYRQMKLSALSSNKKRTPKSPLLVRRKSNPYSMQRDWPSVYEGLPNAEVLSVSVSEETGNATVTIRLASGETLNREVGGLEYLVGRRGSLDYLAPELRSEILGPSESGSDFEATGSLISGHTLRAKAESSLEVAKNVFAIGALTGDSLIRHAVGGCVYTAGCIMGHIPSTYSPTASPIPSPKSLSSPPKVSSLPSEAQVDGPPPIDHADDLDKLPNSKPPSLTTTDKTTSPIPSMPTTPAMNATISPPSPPPSSANTNSNSSNGHEDLHLDRRKLARAVEVTNLENRVWGDSGWWAGGPVGVCVQRDEGTV